MTAQRLYRRARPYRRACAGTVHGCRLNARSLLPTAYSLLPRGHRRAYTLAELLIVITIMIMLMAITLPAVKQVMKDSGMREASRQLNAYFAMAKARALLTGRPCGVTMRCDLPLGGTDPTSGSMPNWPARQVTQLFLAEVPPPYAGGTVGARARIRSSLTLPATTLTYEFYPVTLTAPNTYNPDTAEILQLAGLIELNEKFLVRFDYKGAWFVCQRVIDRQNRDHFIFQTLGDSAEDIYPITGQTSAGSATPLPPEMNNLTAAYQGLPFQIIRLPRRIGNPLELSQGTCIDLAYSGIGPTNLPTGEVEFGMYPWSSGAPPAGLFPSSPAKLETITIMFQPDGGIETVYLNNYAFVPPTSLHFLVGKTDRINLPLGNNATHATAINMFDVETSNLMDPLSIWVSVSKSTGNINTSENSPPDYDRAVVSTSNITINPGPNQQNIDPQVSSSRAYFLSLCRRQATNREQVRGQ